MKKSYSVIIIEKNCKQCGICSQLCPTQVLKQELGCCPVVVNKDACIGCMMCQMRCPDFAIEVEAD